MNRRDSVEYIFDRHLDLIAPAHADDRPKNWRRVAIGWRRLSVNERVPAGHDLKADRIPLLGCIHEPWDRQSGAKRREVTNALPCAQNCARCERSTADGKGASCQGHGLSGIGRAIPERRMVLVARVSRLTDTSGIVIAKVSADRISRRSV